MKKQIPESLRKKLSAAGRKGWLAKVAKAQGKVADPPEAEKENKT